MNEFPIERGSYWRIGLGVIILLLGFLLLSGGASEDPNVFSEDIFSWRRMVLAPIIIVAGFIYIGWAIMRKPKTEE